MISSINAGSSITMPSSSRSEKALTEDQLTLISDTLSELDTDNLTTADALSILETFSDAGIEPGKAMESTMSELGFDAQEIGDLANVEGDRPPPPPPPPSQSSDEISSMASYLEELLEETVAASEAESIDELSEEQRFSVYAQVMEKFGIEEGDSLIDTTA
ncbi:hypothetical protein MT390_08925 [Vibrio sp. 2-Bac 85]|uniref:hypothetical protein n=1 Tax=Psychromonas sp. SA13A TaxID=2686346 RepID=UPI00140DC049|nr:hypothetical protein [Psychromonas sp. SA13A]